MGNAYITDAVCLKTYDYSESSQILHLLSSDQGSIRAIAKGIKRPKSGLAGSTHLFQISTFQCIRGKSLDTVTQYRPVQSFSSVGADLLASGLACGCADVLRWAVPEHDPHCGDVFDTFRQYLTELNRVCGPNPNVPSPSAKTYQEPESGSIVTSSVWTPVQGVTVALTVDTLLILSETLGLAPSMDSCAVCHTPILDDGQPKRFSMPLHGVIHSQCQPHAETVTPHQTADWAKLTHATWQVLQAPLKASKSWRDLGDTPLSPLRFMAYYLSVVLEHRIPSFDVAFAMHA